LEACNISNDSDLAWIGLDSSKRQNPEMPIFVLQSSAEFAQGYLDAQDLSSAAQQMLSRAAQLLIPGLAPRNGCKFTAGAMLSPVIL
jgi:predicted NAD/FAD-dependent oxidoreductase